MKYSIQSSIAWQICERPRLGVAKNVQQFVPRNTRGCPAVTQIAGNKYVSGARPSVSPHGCCLCARICQEWCTCACEGGKYVSADLGNFGVCSYRGVVLSKGMGEATLRICLCDRLTSAVCFVYELIIVICYQKCGCE